MERAWLARDLLPVTGSIQKWWGIELVESVNRLCLRVAEIHVWVTLKRNKILAKLGYDIEVLGVRQTG